jgi:hypothetical protein
VDHDDTELAVEEVAAFAKPQRQWKLEVETVKGGDITCCGSRFPAVNSIKRAMLNFQLNLETPNATNDAKRRIRIKDGTVMMNVLR